MQYSFGFGVKLCSLCSDYIASQAKMPAHSATGIFAGVGKFMRESDKSTTFQIPFSIQF